MDRRKFMRMAATAGSVAWALPLHNVFAQTSSYPQGVPFVTDPSVTGLTPEDLNTLFQQNANVTPQQQAATFPQSVASGDPRVDGAVLWTRVDPSAQGGQYATLIAYEIASTNDFATGAVVAAGVAVIDATRDNTVKLPMSFSGLQPFSTYYYRFYYNGIPSRTGRFKTLPAATADLTQLRLGYVVCQDYGNGYYNALSYLAQENVDYVIHLGDYIYETIASSSFQSNPVRTVPPFASGGAIPQSLDDYRHLYRTYRSDVNQQAAHEAFTYIQLWDDHEFANDCHQDFHPDNNTAPNDATTPQPALRQAANQAWIEYGLADVPYDLSQDWEHSVTVYRKFSFGTLADLVITDERLYRDGPPCGNNEAFQRYFSTGCAELSDPSRSMLGLTQRQWFLDQVTSPPALWKLWANEVMLMQLKLTAIYIDLDQWDGYPQERSLLLSSIRDAGVHNFVALTGDLHTFLAGYLKTDFNNLFERPMGIELMVGSITSANFAEEIEAAVPLSSRALPAKQMGVPPNLLDPVIRLANPHIQYWDSSTHGYGVLTITKSSLTCEFKAVSTITQPTASLVSLKTFTVPVNEVRLQS